MQQARITHIQEALVAEQIDAWLFYSFRHNNPFMHAILGLDPHRVQTRRCAYLIPAVGEPVKLVHNIELEQFDVLPGDTHRYSGWSELEAQLKTILSPFETVAMEYSPHAAIPTVSIVDAGTFELVRSASVEVVSSATLIQAFEATWTDDEYASHARAAEVLYDCVKETFAEVARRVTQDGETDEYAIQQFMVDYMTSRGMEMEHPPIVSVNENSANPHYEVGPERSSTIREGDFLLIDLWCKDAGTPRAMYADITWTGYVGARVPEAYVQIFDVVARARDAASEFVTQAFKDGRRIRGAEVDDVCRQVIIDAGYGEYFTHRTGHSIGENVHGNGTNIDNLETRDERFLIPRTCFSIEPGIYLPDRFGIRSEIDVYIHPDGCVEETGKPKQTEVVPIM